MNPFQEDGNRKTFFGKNLIEWVSTGKKVGRHYRNWQYGKMKAKQIAKRRKANKVGYRSRRINRLRSQGKNIG